MADEAQRQALSEVDLERALLELVRSVQTLGENVDTLHRGLSRDIEEKVQDLILRELDRLKELAQKNAQVVQILPITTADRLERLIDKKVDGALEDVRITVSELKNKLSAFIQNKEMQGAIPAAPVDDISDVTGRIEMKKDRLHIQFKTEWIEKTWKVARWVVAAIAAGGGGWALIKSIFKIP